MNSPVAPPPSAVDIHRQALVRALVHPLTWAPPACIAAAGALPGMPQWACLLAALMALGGVAALWARRWPGLVQRERTALFLAHCQRENKALERRIKQIELPWMHGQPFGKTLHEAVEIKRAAEKRLFRDGAFTESEEEISRMIADLTRILIEEAEKFSSEKQESPPDGAAMERFEKAAGTLREAAREIDTLLDPSPEALRAPVPADALSEASGRLGQRIEQARNVRRFMEESMQRAGLSDAGAGESGGGQQRSAVSEG